MSSIKVLHVVRTIHIIMNQSFTSGAKCLYGIELPFFHLGSLTTWGRGGGGEKMCEQITIQLACVHIVTLLYAPKCMNIILP